MKLSFREKLKKSEPLIGTIQTSAAGEVTEILQAAGFDWLFIDMEHSALDVPAVQRILQFIGNNGYGIVRVPLGTEAWVKRVLDAGAQGVIFPQVNTAEQAKQAVRLCKYPSQGCRGVGIARAQGYGLNFAGYVAKANEEVAVILQIEHIEAVKNIKEIVQVPGIDALFIGPYDLSGSMGKIGQVNDPEILEQIETVRSTCLAAGLALGIFTVNPGDVKTFIEKGYTLITLGIDVFFLGQAVQQALAAAKS